jgi:hypothetical protein
MRSDGEAPLLYSAARFSVLLPPPLLSLSDEIESKTSKKKFKITPTGKTGGQKSLSGSDHTPVRPDTNGQKHTDRKNMTTRAQPRARISNTSNGHKNDC